MISQGPPPKRGHNRNSHADGDSNPAIWGIWTDGGAGPCRRQPGKQFKFGRSVSTPRTCRYCVCTNLPIPINIDYVYLSCFLIHSHCMYRRILISWLNLIILGFISCSFAIMRRAAGHCFKVLGQRQVLGAHRSRHRSTQSSDERRGAAVVRSQQPVELRCWFFVGLVSYPSRKRWSCCTTAVLRFWRSPCFPLMAWWVRHSPAPTLPSCLLIYDIFCLPPIGNGWLVDPRLCFWGLVQPQSSVNHPAFSRGYLVLFLQIWVASAISTSWIIMISVPLTIISRTVIAVCILHEWYCDSWVTIWLMHIFGVIYYPGSIIHIVYHPITN